MHSTQTLDSDRLDTTGTARKSMISHKRLTTQRPATCTTQSTSTAQTSHSLSWIHRELREFSRNTWRRARAGAGDSSWRREEMERRSASVARLATWVPASPCWSPSAQFRRLFVLRWGRRMPAAPRRLPKRFSPVSSALIVAPITCW